MDLTQTFQYATRVTPEPPHIWMKNKVASPPDTDKPNIVIVIDDVTSRTAPKVLGAAGSHPITLAFLPNGTQQDDLDMAKSLGHDVIVHMPMEPMNWKERGIQLEDHTLMTDYSETEIGFVMSHMLDQLHGHIGANNHMGSALMQDPEDLDAIMTQMRARGLLFLDSRTVPSPASGEDFRDLAKDKAHEHGVDYIGKDVFLDHDPDAVWEQLAKVEALAERDGFVVAIGHPHAQTMKALGEWMPKASEKFDFMPLGTHAVKTLGLDAPQMMMDAAPAPSTVFKPD
ncbi:MAG: divergent polysaccharide deacetylase family protein [Alphaproteobacteria bacterium]